MRALALLALALLAGGSFVPGASRDEIQPHDPRNLTWIEPGVLALGGGGLDESEVDWLHGQGFRAIANFRIEHEDPVERMTELGIEHLYVPIDNAKHMNVTQLETFVEWMREQRDAGRPTYIHCTNGWHRAATMAVAWLMAEKNMSFDEAAEFVREERGWGVMMRAPYALEAYEAKLRGEPVLRVTLHAPQVRPEDQANGTMPAWVLVQAGAEPAVGANVSIKSEESRIKIRGVTDGNGRFEFTYTPPPTSALDHVYAVATLDGWHQGADSIDINYRRPVPTPFPLEIDARLVDGGVEVRVTKNGSQRTPAHVMAWTADGRHAAHDVSGVGVSFLPLDHAGQDVFVSANEWGMLPSEVRLEALPVTPTVASPTTAPTMPTPAPTPDEAPETTTSPGPTPTGPSESTDVRAVPLGGVLALGAAAGVALARRRR